MIIKILHTMLLGVLALLLIQCNAVDTTHTPGDSLIPTANNGQEQLTQPVPNTQDPLNQINDIQMNPTDSHPINSGLQSLIDTAKEDLAQRLSISITQISLVEVKEVIWPDASLGCPQPGMKYKQVPVDGAQIILQVDGTIYNYHTGGSRGIFLCEQDFKKPPRPTQIDLTQLTPAIIDKDNLSPTTPENGIPPGEDQ